MRGSSISILSLLLLSTHWAESVSGYDRLYNPFNGVTIDLLYDDHIPQAHITMHTMEHASVEFIEKRLEQTERKVMELFRLLNKRPKGSVALVWEQGINKDAHTEFIGHSHRLVRDQFRNIRYIPSDISRDAFETLIYRSQKRGKRVSTTLYGCSLDNPLPLSKEQKEAIVRYSGVKAWYAYKQLYAKTIKSLKRHFSNRAYCTFEDFDHNDVFDALADCEMLSHILAAPEKQVILFAGGWHSGNIRHFLHNTLSCLLVRSSQPESRKVSLAELDKMGRVVSIKNMKKNSRAHTSSGV